MNKQSENKPSLQDEPNKPNPAKDELTSKTSIRCPADAPKTGTRSNRETKWHTDPVSAVAAWFEPA